MSDCSFFSFCISADIDRPFKLSKLLANIKILQISFIIDSEVDIIRLVVHQLSEFLPRLIQLKLDPPFPHLDVIQLSIDIHFLHCLPEGTSLRQLNILDFAPVAEIEPASSGPFGLLL